MNIFVLAMPVLFGVMLLFLANQERMTGAVRFRNHTYTKEEKPFIFWSSIGFAFFFSALFIIIPLGILVIQFLMKA